MDSGLNSLGMLLGEMEILNKKSIINQWDRLAKFIQNLPNQENDFHFIDFSTLSNISIKINTDEIQKIFVEFKKIKKEENQLSKEKSIRFNVLNFFHIDETLHSRLLGFFLDKNGSHGQGDFFLRKFIEKLGFTNYEEGKWNVTIEKQKIDILIERKYPHSVIIIENKSNNATDQPNQIYRYWHRAIFKINKEISNDNNRYKIIYLVSNDGKLHSENSITKPACFSKDLPEKVPLNIKTWNFNNQIISWLNECLLDVPDENYRLKEYIKQYIEYWN